MLPTVRQFVDKYWNLLLSPGPGGSAVRGTLGSFAVRVGAVIIAFLLNVALARYAGRQDYGAFVFLTAVLQILLIPACLGFDKLLIKISAVEQAQGRLAVVRAALWNATTVVAGLGAILGLLLIAVAHATHGANVPGLVAASLFAGALVPVVASLRVLGATIQGLGFAARSQVPEYVVYPAMLLVLAAAAHGRQGSLLGVTSIMGLSLIAAVLALALSILLLRPQVRSASSQFAQRWLSRSVLRSAFPMMLVGALYVAGDQLAPLLLGIEHGATQVALFGAAEKWSVFVGFMLQVANPVMAPRFATYFHEHNIYGLQRLLTRSTLVVALFGLLPFLAMLIAPRLFLSSFGAGFGEAAPGLMIMAGGQFVNAATGLVGVLLLMTGHERDIVFSLATGTLTNLIVCLAAIRPFGVSGAAAGAAAGAVVGNVMMSLFVFYRHGVYPSILGPLFRRLEIRKYAES